MTRRATKPAITAEQRTALIKQVRAGYPPAIAASKAGVEMAAVRRAGARLQAEIAEAEAYASAHLDALLLEKGLSGDAACLRLAIERRDRAADRAAEPLIDLDSDEAFELARRIAFLLASADPKPAPVSAPTPARVPPPAPEPEPPRLPEGYSLNPETAQILRRDGSLCGHALSLDRAIEVAVSDLARNSRISPEDRTPFWSGPPATKDHVQ